MARGRILDRQISLSRKLAKLWDSDPHAALFWTWMMPHLDDYGRQEADPAVLKAAVCPLVSSVSVDDVESILERLEEVGLIHCYVPDGHDDRFLQVVNFDKFQRYLRGRVGSYPDPSGAVPSTGGGKASGSSTTPLKRERTGAHGRANGAPHEGTKEPQTSFPPTPRDANGRSHHGEGAPALGGGAPPWVEDPRDYPESVVRFEPGRVVKIPETRIEGNRMIDRTVEVGPYGGYGNRELGVWVWDGWGPKARASPAWQPQDREEAALEAGS